MLLLLLACLPRDPEAVEALATQAVADPQAMEKLVHSLSSSDEEVWQQAYAELLRLGPVAAPALREAVVTRKPEAPRALLCLGEMGDPANFDLLFAAMKVPPLVPWATRALELAEIELQGRFDEDPDACYAYLEWFPEGQGEADARRCLEEEAERRERARHRSAARALLAGGDPEAAWAEAVAARDPKLQAQVREALSAKADAAWAARDLRTLRAMAAQEGLQGWWGTWLDEQLVALHAEIGALDFQAVAERGGTEDLQRLRDAEALLVLAAEAVEAGIPVRGPFPAAGLRDDGELRRLAAAGVRPWDPSQNLFVRAQLLRWTLEAPSRCTEVVREDAARYSAWFVGQVRLPADRLESRLVCEEVAGLPRGPQRVALQDGAVGDLTVREEADLLIVEIQLRSGSWPGEGAVVDGVTVLLGAGPELLRAWPDARKVELRISATRDSGDWSGLAVPVALGLSRSSAERMNWPLVRGEMPFTIDHLALVPDQRVEL